MTNAVTVSAEQVLIDVWQKHMHAEFIMKDAKAALGTMSDNPYVFMVPLALGAKGRGGVYDFYRDYFIPQIPADMTSVPISQVAGKDRIVEEAVYTFTHDQVMDWLIPGVPATGKRVEVGIIVVVKFEGDKIASEHLYWDHASVLAQVGVIDPNAVPVKGAESARSLLSWTGLTPSSRKE